MELDFLCVNPHVIDNCEGRPSTYEKQSKMMNQTEQKTRKGIRLYYQVLHIDIKNMKHIKYCCLLILSYGSSDALA